MTVLSGPPVVATGLASLAMYDQPFLQAANDRLWAAVAARLRRGGWAGVPEALTRDRPLMEVWGSDDLILGQTCGYPYMRHLCDRVRLVATPCFHTPWTRGPRYCSVILVPRSHPASSLAQLAGARVAFNSTDSQSGYNVLRAMVAPLARAGRFFGALVETGAHSLSIAAVAEGRADVAAVDAVTFALTRDHAPERVAAVRVLAVSPTVPGLPLVTRAAASDADVARLREALVAAFADPATAAARRALRLTGLAMLEAADYRPILAMEAAAQDAGYPALA